MDQTPATTSTPTLHPASNRANYILIAGVVLVAVLTVAIAALVLTRDNNTPSNNANYSSSQSVYSQASTVAANPDLIKHLGINLELYNPVTKTAGDVVFTDKKLGEYDVPYFDYGFQVEASSAGPARRNPQPTFIVPLGTKVHALVDGVVVDVPKLYSNDYSIHISTSEQSPFIFETEHVINPVVKKGDRVTAGQVIAEVSNYDAHNYAGFGLYEIGILKGGNPPSHVCPFQYLDPAIQEDVYAKLRSLYKGWNDYRGKQVYDENLAIPGCITTEPVEG